MVAVKAGEAEGFIGHLGTHPPVILVFGPDSGLVRERTERLIKNAVDDPADPFLLARIEADELSANPMRLVEEAQTIPMFGGRRAVWLRANPRYNIVPAVGSVLALPAIECRIVIEAGDLRRGAALRTLCERAKSAAAIPCYSDDANSLARLIDQELREAGQTIAPDARAMLVPLLGGDRMSSRNELRKLVLYAAGKERIEADDIAAVVANASALAIDAVIDAAFAGRLLELETEFAKLVTAGTSPTAIVGAGLRQAIELHKMRLQVEGGSSVSAVIQSKQPPIYFGRRSLVETTLRRWTAARLRELMTQFGKTALDMRRQPALAEAIVRRCLLAIAHAAARGATAG